VPSVIVYTDIDDASDRGGNIVIEVRAAGVCFPDLLLTKGKYQLQLPPPFVPGMETAGVVRSAPADSGFRVGERVSAFGVLGCYAEQVAVPASNVIRSPAELDDAEAVSLLVNYNTMYFAFKRRAELRAGDSYVVPPKTAHYIHGKNDGPCRFLLLQGVGVYDNIPVDG